MNSTRGFSEVRNDPEWVSRTLVLAGYMLTAACIPFFGQAIAEGAAVETMKRDLRGERGLAPAGFDGRTVSAYLEPGFQAMLVQLAWGFASLLVVLPVMGLFIFVGAALARGTGGDAGVLAPLMFLGIVVVMAAFFLGIGAVVTVAQIRVALTGKLGEGFALGAIFASVRRLGWDLVGGMIVNGLLFMLVGIVAYLMCVLPVFVVAGYFPLAMAYFRADLARLDVARGGDLPLPPGLVAAQAETFA